MLYSHKNKHKIKYFNLVKYISFEQWPFLTYKLLVQFGHNYKMSARQKSKM